MHERKLKISKRVKNMNMRTEMQVRMNGCFQYEKLDFFSTKGRIFRYEWTLPTLKAGVLISE